MRVAFDESITIKQQYESLIATLVSMDKETNKKVQSALLKISAGGQPPYMSEIKLLSPEAEAAEKQDIMS